MAGIPKEEINRIQSQANIIDVISNYISLEKKGSNYFGVCPFHGDKGPSLSVNETMKFWKCFGCNKSGTVFDFVREIEHVSFPEAVKIVADKIGTKIDGVSNVTYRYTKHLEALDFAMKFYQLNIQSKEGHDAKEYLLKRGLSEEIINEFEIGYAISKPDNLSKILLSKGYDENILLETGLANIGNSLYDLFRDRITFPIHNADGRCVGFSARIYKDIDEAKYINTKETPVFKKGNILFNYHRASKEASNYKYILVVEGQMDAIRIYSSGIKSVVATMGTALTQKHVALLKRLGVDVILAFDNDNAGLKATITNGDILANEDVNVKVLRIKDAKDPDEYILKNGIDSYKAAIEHSVNYFDFKLANLKEDKDLNKIEDLNKYINQVIKELNKSNDPILRELTINDISNKYNIDKQVLLNKLDDIADTKKVYKEVVTLKEKKEKLDNLTKTYRSFIYYLLNDIKYIQLYNQELGYLPDKKYDEIAQEIVAFYLKFNYINMADFVANSYESDFQEELDAIVSDNLGLKLFDNDFIGYIKKIKDIDISSRIKYLKEKMKNETDINEQSKIMDEIIKLKKDGK
jgi:DNA primase